MVLRFQLKLYAGFVVCQSRNGKKTAEDLIADVIAKVKERNSGVTLKPEVRIVAIN